MTPQTRIRRIGWLAILILCAAAYSLLHLKVNAVHAEVVRAERKIVRLEQRNMLLETEVLARSSQEKLAQWNRVEFGLNAPAAKQYIESERQLAEFGGPPAENAPAPIRLASLTGGEAAPEFPAIAETRRAPTRAPTRAQGPAGSAPQSHVRVAISSAEETARQ